MQTDGGSKKDREQQMSRDTEQRWGRVGRLYLDASTLDLHETRRSTLMEEEWEGV